MDLLDVAPLCNLSPGHFFIMNDHILCFCHYFLKELHRMIFVAEGVLPGYMLRRIWVTLCGLVTLR